MATPRPGMTARIVPLDSPAAGDPRMGGSPSERAMAVLELTEHAWRLAGRPFPTYTRATMPGRLATLADSTSRP